MNEQLELTETTTTGEKVLSQYDIERAWVQQFKDKPLEKFTIEKSEFNRLSVVSPKVFVVSSNINALQSVTLNPPPPSDVLDVSFERMKAMFATLSLDMLVTFNNDAQYLYKFVPNGVQTSMAQSDSVGKYFATNVKGQYVTYKVETVVETSETGEESEIIVFTLTK